MEENNLNNIAQLIYKVQGETATWNQAAVWVYLVGLIFLVVVVLIQYRQKRTNYLLSSFFGFSIAVIAYLYQHLFRYFSLFIPDHSTSIVEMVEHAQFHLQISYLFMVTGFVAGASFFLIDSLGKDKA